MLLKAFELWKQPMSKPLPADLKVLITDSGIWLDIESFIAFLRNDDNVTSEYQAEAKHLKNMAAYLESCLGELMAQKAMIDDDNFNKDLPN